MQLNPTVTFNGQCEEAFRFYAESLGGKIQTMMAWGESPMADQVPSELRNKIMHATLIIGEYTLMGSDALPDQYQRPTGFYVTLVVKDPSEAKRIFDALSESGTVTMPLQATFWSAGFGMLVDRFGIPWMINCERAA